MSYHQFFKDPKSRAAECRAIASKAACLVPATHTPGK
jgi:hypothetical protein